MSKYPVHFPRMFREEEPTDPRTKIFRALGLSVNASRLKTPGDIHQVAAHVARMVEDDPDIPGYSDDELRAHMNEAHSGYQKNHDMGSLRRLSRLAMECLSRHEDDEDDDGEECIHRGEDARVGVDYDEGEGGGTRSEGGGDLGGTRGEDDNENPGGSDTRSGGNWARKGTDYRPASVKGGHSRRDIGNEPLFQEFVVHHVRQK